MRKTGGKTRGSRAGNRIRRALSNWGERGLKAKYVRKYRRLDRLTFEGLEGPEYGPFKYFTDSGAKELSHAFDTNLVSTARRLKVRNRRPVHVLDVGAGQGLLGLDLQDALGRANVEYHANGLARPFEARSNGSGYRAVGLRARDRPEERFASYRVGNFKDRLDRWYRNGSFDLIVSRATTSFGFDDLRRVAKKLAPGGEAFVQMTVARKPLQDASAWLNQNGFSIQLKRATGDRRTVIAFFRIKRTNGA